MDYVHLVVISDGVNRLCQAPAWSDIKKGDKVIVDGYKTPVKVVTAMTCSKDSTEYQFIMDCAQHKDQPLPKIRERVVAVPVQYEDDKNERDKG